MNVPLWIATITLAGCSEGCVSAHRGARPNDMSLAAHEAAAKEHSAAAATQAALFDPEASERREQCMGGKARTPFGSCWTSVVNPTAAHLDKERRQRAMAAEHRKSSKVLAYAEMAACTGLDERDRDMSPFEHHEDIAESEPLLPPPSGVKGAPQKLLGASIVFRAVPGISKEYLQRLVDCHVARNASMGFAMPEMSHCPLSVAGAHATVDSTRSGFRIDIRAEERAHAQEILQRAKALSSAP
jgi:hypothetical protein